MQESDGQFEIASLHTQLEEQLQKLLSRVTPENMHHENFFGMEVGEEKW